MIALATASIVMVSCGGGKKEEPAPNEKAAATIEDKAKKIGEELAAAKKAGDTKKVEELEKQVAEMTYELSEEEAIKLSEIVDSYDTQDVEDAGE